MKLTITLAIILIAGAGMAQKPDPSLKTKADTARYWPSGTTNSQLILQPEKADTVMVWFKEVVLWNRGWLCRPGMPDSVVSIGQPQEIWRPGFMVVNHSPTLAIYWGNVDSSIPGTFLYIDKIKCSSKILCYIERTEDKGKEY